MCLAPCKSAWPNSAGVAKTIVNMCLFLHARALVHRPKPVYRYEKYWAGCYQLWHTTVLFCSVLTLVTRESSLLAPNVASHCSRSVWHSGPRPTVSRAVLTNGTQCGYQQPKPRQSPRTLDVPIRSRTAVKDHRFPVGYWQGGCVSRVISSLGATVR